MLNSYSFSFSSCCCYYSYSYFHPVTFERVISRWNELSLIYHPLSVLVLTSNTATTGFVGREVKTCFLWVLNTMCMQARCGLINRWERSTSIISTSILPIPLLNTDINWVKHASSLLLRRVHPVSRCKRSQISKSELALFMLSPALIPLQALKRL